MYGFPNVTYFAFQYQDIDGMTPLMAAVDKDHLPTVDFLLKEVSH